VLILNRRFRHAVERKVARQLIDHAKEHAPEHATEIRTRVHAWLRGAQSERTASTMTREQFLDSWGASLTKSERQVLAKVYDQAAAHGRLPELTTAPPEE
jgi:hypothetical protein